MRISKRKIEKGILVTYLIKQHGMFCKTCEFPENYTRGCAIQRKYEHIDNDKRIRKLFWKIRRV